MKGSINFKQALIITIGLHVVGLILIMTYSSVRANKSKIAREVYWKNKLQNFEEKQPSWPNKQNKELVITYPVINQTVAQKEPELNRIKRINIDTSLIQKFSNIADTIGSNLNNKIEQLENLFPKEPPKTMEETANILRKNVYTLNNKEAEELSETLIKKCYDLKRLNLARQAAEEKKDQLNKEVEKLKKQLDNQLNKLQQNNKETIYLKYVTNGNTTYEEHKEIIGSYTVY